MWIKPCPLLLSRSSGCADGEGGPWPGALLPSWRAARPGTLLAPGPAPLRGGHPPASCSASLASSQRRLCVNSSGAPGITSGISLLISTTRGTLIVPVIDSPNNKHQGFKLMPVFCCTGHTNRRLQQLHAQGWPFCSQRKVSPGEYSDLPESPPRRANV